MNGICDFCDSTDTVHNVTVTRELHQQGRVIVIRTYSCNECGAIFEEED